MLQSASRKDIPVVYIIQNAIGLGFAMSKQKIFSHPGNKMIFECSFNNLMEKIWCNKLMYISTWEIISKGLEIETLIK